MKTKYVVFLAMIFISQIKGDEGDERRCRNETNVQQSDVDNYLKFKLPETREGKCYGACVMKTSGIMNRQGKILSSGAERFSDNYINSQEQRVRVHNAVKMCSRSANNLTDECETSYSFLKCLGSMKMSNSSKSRSRNNGSLTITPPSISFQIPPLTFVLFSISAL